MFTNSERLEKKHLVSFVAFEKRHSSALDPGPPAYRANTLLQGHRCGYNDTCKS